MKYTVTLAGRDFEVDLSGPEARVEGRPVESVLRTLPGTPLRQLDADGRTDLLALVRTEAGWHVQRGGERWLVEVVDERTRVIREMTGSGAAATGDTVVKAPMPGLVLRLEVEVGGTVAPGDGLLVLEAMKMENEIRASGAGTVRRVLVEAGQAVEKGAPLMEIEG